MRIAINTLALNKTKAGMGNYITHLVDEVTADTSHTFFIFTYTHTKQFFPTNPHITYIIIPKVFANGFMKIFFEQCILPGYLLKYQIDLYHNPGFSLPLFCPCSSIVTIADITFFSHPQYHLSKKNFYFRYMMPYAIKKAKAVIAISESTKKDILKYVPVDSTKIHAILLAADVLFKPIEKTKAASFVKNKYRIHHPFVLFVGMLEPRKNISGLIEAFSRIKTEHLLVIVGKKAWMYKDIFLKIKEKNMQSRVIFTEYVPDEDLPFLYSAATVFAYPSFYEGFGIPIVEAMACGCPVITSNNSSMKEIGENVAYLINPYNVEEIAVALHDIIISKEKQKTIAKKGIIHAKKYSWKKHAQETITLYETIK